LRTCSDHALHNRRRPCLLYQLGRCPAPCVYPVSRDEYGQSVEEVALFLEGRGGELLDALRDRMKAAASLQRFEDAARLRDQLFAVERSLERQRVAIAEYRDIDVDVFGFHREADRLLFYVLYVRRGRLNGGQSFYFSGQEFPTEELLESFINLYYDRGNVVPKEVLVPLEPEGGVEGLAELLSERKGEKVRVVFPKRGEKRELQALSNRNAEQALTDRKRSKDETEHVLERLQQRLHLSKVPHRMECFDISHFQGASIVASQVASVDGEADRSRYRRFRIKSVAQQDDFASMYEVMTRRLTRGLAEGDLPDLLIVDGGKGQLGSAQAAMKDLGIEGLDIVGLAKSRDLDVVRSDVEATPKSPERVFVMGLKDPIVLPQNSPELYMLVRLRDEAHRFAITYQQTRMRRGNFRSTLEDIPGVGAGRRRTLLKHFGSLRRVRDATIEELAEVEGFSTALAERVHGFLHEPKSESDSEDALRAESLQDAGEQAADPGVQELLDDGDQPSSEIASKGPPATE
jgi:excinuclease ABC subunit C